MEDLVKQTLVKKPVGLRSDCVGQYQFQPNVKLLLVPIKVRAQLLNIKGVSGKASFIGDYFHKILTEQCTAHMNYLSSHENEKADLSYDFIKANYRYPFDKKIFNFKKKQLTPICEKKGTTVVENQLYDQHCDFYLRLIPYCYPADRLFGMKIQVSKISA